MSLFLEAKPSLCILKPNHVFVCILKPNYVFLTWSQGKSLYLVALIQTMCLKPKFVFVSWSQTMSLYIEAKQSLRLLKLNHVRVSWSQVKPLYFEAKPSLEARLCFFQNSHFTIEKSNVCKTVSISPFSLISHPPTEHSFPLLPILPRPLSRTTIPFSSIVSLLLNQNLDWILSNLHTHSLSRACQDGRKATEHGRKEEGRREAGVKER